MQHACQHSLRAVTGQSEVSLVSGETLPAPIVEELADGLAETRQSYLRKGLATDLAAEAAVSEFGEPHLIVPSSPG
jgi:hypothetical protein